MFCSGRMIAVRASEFRLEQVESRVVMHVVTLSASAQVPHTPESSGILRVAGVEGDVFEEIARASANSSAVEPLGADLAARRAPALRPMSWRTSIGVSPRGRRRASRDDATHCQTCARQISAVAASSIRL